MKHRLEYVDALRGLAILLVVFMHMPQYGFGQSVGGYYMELATLLAEPAGRAPRQCGMPRGILT